MPADKDETVAPIASHLMDSIRSLLVVEGLPAACDCGRRRTGEPTPPALRPPLPGKATRRSCCVAQALPLEQPPHALAGARATGSWLATATIPRERIVAFFDDRGERTRCTAQCWRSDAGEHCSTALTSPGASSATISSGHGIALQLRHGAALIDVVHHGGA